MQLCTLDMSGETDAPSEKITVSISTSMVSDRNPGPQAYSRSSRTSRSSPRVPPAFGKRSNSMRRNANAEVAKQGWLYKQASSGVKQWNKRWFVLADRCLFYYKDEKEDAVLGSLPLLSFRIQGVAPLDNITRKFAFKVKLEKEEGELRGPVVFCMAQQTGTRTFYFSADRHEDQEDWIRALSEAAGGATPRAERMNAAVDLNPAAVATATERPAPHTQTHHDAGPYPKANGVDRLETPPLSAPGSDQVGENNNARLGGSGGEGEDEGGGGGGGGGPAPDHPAHRGHHPNGWGNTSKAPPPSRSHSRHCAPRGHQQGGAPSHDPRELQDNVVLRRGFVPSTAPERAAQRKTSMAQLQQWVNQRRVMASQEDLHSPSCYYPGASGEYYGFPGGPPYVEEYPLYPPGGRPDSICSAVGGYDRRWTFEEKRHSLRDRPPPLYGPMSREQWGPAHYGGAEPAMRRLSIQPRSRSVPRSPSSSSGGRYSPGPPHFASPARSPSAPFERFRLRDDAVYADPAAYGLRRSLSSPRYDYPGDRRSLSQGLYHYNYPVSPSIHSRMEDMLDLQLQRNLEYLDQQLQPRVSQVPPVHDVFSRELHPTLQLNEVETSKLLGRLCEQNRTWKDHEAVVHRLRMEKDGLEEALVLTHQEMDRYQNQPLAVEKLRFRKETLQNQLINIRGELSQASSALTTSRMEFEALEDEANAIHGDLWEQLNAGGQSRFHLAEQNHLNEVQDLVQDRQSTMNNVGIVPPRTKSPTDESHSRPAGVSRQNGRRPSGISRERPKSAVFPAELKSKMSVEEQNERIRRNQSSSVRDKRRSLNLSAGQSPANYRVIRRRLTAHEIDIKDLEVAVRGQGQESPREEIARLRRLKVDPELYDIGKEMNLFQLLTPDKVLIPERYLELEDSAPLSPEEEQEKQRKLERIKTLIAKSNLQNMVPLLDGPVEGGSPVSSQQQLQEQEKRIEISCALANEASRRSRLLSAQCPPSPPTSPTSLAPPPSSADFPKSAHIMEA
ncbi:pleckstrin homology domain-containing family A member 6 isoform X7 [Pseudoliparis swirei]|uniref:pleckstrin homology domain-containing family A member 6 isoform X7 n=1 Tax=Pseudoliparis swirei TaxID=2059687 RepID=UPI0024BD8DCD|nr:pleckstrin homology domain-containing family A member 6 isoform X7 [Pseudoliparis swirei]